MSVMQQHDYSEVIQSTYRGKVKVISVIKSFKLFVFVKT
jgi:hypothetical protein